MNYWLVNTIKTHHEATTQLAALKCAKQNVIPQKYYHAIYSNKINEYSKKTKKKTKTAIIGKITKNHYKNYQKACFVQVLSFVAYLQITHTHTKCPMFFLYILVIPSFCSSTVFSLSVSTFLFSAPLLFSSLSTFRTDFSVV